MVYCVGLTGSIASGKSTIAGMFSELGIQVIDADKLSKELTQKNQIAYREIINRYGAKILNEDEELNRRMLRAIIFSDLQERLWLEQLLHPLIRQTIKKQVDSCITPYCLIEIPLLIDKKNYPYINRILLVTAPQKTQIHRIMQRDQCTSEEALAILAAQPNSDLRVIEADDVLINNLELDKSKSIVSNFHQMYLKESQGIF
jgi:dephospho-CoA kinase